MKIQKTILITMFFLALPIISAYQYDINGTIVEIREDVQEDYETKSVNWTYIDFEHYGINRTAQFMCYKDYTRKMCHYTTLNEENETIWHKNHTCARDIYNNYIETTMRDVLAENPDNYKDDLTPVEDLQTHLEIEEDENQTLVRVKDGVIVGTILTESKIPQPNINYMKLFFDRTSLWNKATHYAYTIFNGRDTLDLEERIRNLEGAMSQMAVETCAESNNKYTWCSLDCLENEYWDDKKNKCVEIAE